jgi:Uma2 family endonuclease
MPDVSFIAWARCPQRRRPVGNVWAVIPNLAVEILSAGNTLGELRRKRDDYFLAGVELVWEIDPRTRTIAVFTQAAEPDVTLAEGATLTGGTVLPGFLLPLTELFAELDRTG